MPAVDVRGLTIDDCYYTVSRASVVDQLEVGFGGESKHKTGIAGLKFYGVEENIIHSIAKQEMGGREYRKFNGDFSLPVDGHMESVVLEDAKFIDYDQAASYVLAANEIEREKADEMMKEIEEAYKLYDRAKTLIEEE
ncbi:MAG: hypothetical protein ACOC3V_01045 [bacterium]